MRFRRFLMMLTGAVLIAGLGAAAFFTRDQWRNWIAARPSAAREEDKPLRHVEEPKVLNLSPQARANLGIVSKPVGVQTYWRTIQIPGVIIDRPGHSDRGIPAPAVGVVTKVHAFPGDTIRTGDRLFSIRLVSEYLQNSQSELFKSTRDVQLVKEQRDRLESTVKSGALPVSRLIELDNQLRRLTAAVQSYRQDLLTRGLSPSQIEGVAGGKFVSEMEVVAPVPIGDDRQSAAILPVSHTPGMDRGSAPTYEVQELKVELGQQVQAGQVLCLLANHQSLYIEGNSFKREAPYLERAAQSDWPVRVEFAEDSTENWPPLEQTFSIRHLANVVDPVSRTFAFYVPLLNQSRSYRKGDRTFLVWRFRPGQRVRLHVPVEELKEAIVLPAAAIAREGPEAFVFQQNGDLFHRKPVRILHEDRLHVVLANDGSVAPGLYVAQSAAASLNRVLKAQAASGFQADVHVHADGTVHGEH